MPEVLVTAGVELLLVDSPTQELLELARQGPPGPPGPTGAPGGTSMSVLAGEALGGHRAVLIDAGLLARYADNNQPQHLGRLAGITQGAVAAGVSVPVINFGTMTEPSWSWTAGSPVYLGTNGLLTQTLPLTGFIQVVGIALAATTIFINPREPLVTS